MGHAFHFLSRLERLSMPEVELALSLYRDVKLLKDVIGACDIPEGAERVAIALGREPTSSHLVVTRDGGFVTCLAEGMALVNLPEISRGRLDVVARRLRDLRERLAIAERASGTGQRTKRLLLQLSRGGHRLGKEEVSALTGLAPLIGRHFAKWLIRQIMKNSNLHEVVAWQCESIDLRHLDGTGRDLLKAYWDSAWSFGHITAVISDQLDRVLQGVIDEDTKRFPPISWPAMSLTLLAPGARSMLMAARAGKLLLPTYENFYRSYRDCWGFADLVENGAGLAVIALAHESRRARCLEALDCPVVPEPSQSGPLVTLGPGMPKRLMQVVKEPERTTEEAVARGRREYLRLVAPLPKSSAWRTENPEDVPAELAIPALASKMGFFGAGEPLDDFLSLLPTIARAEPENLYLPGALLEELEATHDEDWVEREAWELLASYRKIFARPAPVRREKRVRPNEPCPCGSGKKHKRCCGAMAEPEPETDAALSTG